MKHSLSEILAKFSLLAALAVLVLNASGCIVSLLLLSGRQEPDQGNLECIDDGGVIVSEYGINSVDESNPYRLFPDRRYILDKPLAVSKHNGRIWHTLQSNRGKLEAVSCNNTICESLSFPTYGGETVSSVYVLGEISDELMVLEIRAKRNPSQASENNTILYVCCLYNRLSGEFGEEVERYRYKPGAHANSLPSISMKKGILYRYDPASKEYAVYDLEDKRWRSASDYKKIADAVDHNGNLSGSRMHLVWPEDFAREGFAAKYCRHDDHSLEITYCYDSGLLADYLSIWDWDPENKQYVRNADEKYHFSVPRTNGRRDVSPDGKRVLIIDDKDCGNNPYMFDMSTGILVQVADFAQYSANYGGSWSPSGRYITLEMTTRGDPISGHGYPDLYGLEISTGRYKLLSSAVDNDLWLGVPRSKREVNIVYADWLLTLLERGAAEKKICARLQEFLSVEQTIALQQWRAWFEAHKDYFVWSEKEQRLFVDPQAHEAGVSSEVWAAIPQDTRARWNQLGDADRRTVRAKAEANLDAEKKLFAAAWNAGVDLKVWKHIPSEVRDKWMEITDEKRIEEISIAKKEYLKAKTGN